MNKEKQVQRRSYLKQLVNDYDADGILYLQMKFCEYWSYERVMGVHDMNEVGGHTLHRRREGIHDGIGRPAPHEVPGLCRKHRDKEAPGR